MKKYVIIGPQRSGTTLVHFVLRGHPEVSALNDEVQINSLFKEGISLFTFGNDEEAEKQKGYKRAFDMLAGLSSDDKTKAMGIKCAVHSKEEAETFVESVYSNFPDIKIILIIRQDLLAQFGSLKRAQLTGKWHSWIKSKDNPGMQLKVDIAEYSWYFLRNMEIIQTLRSLKETHECIEVSYEEDIMQNPIFHNKLYEFLDLQMVEPVWLNSQKVAPEPEEFISNYDAVKKMEPTLLETGRPIDIVTKDKSTTIKVLEKILAIFRVGKANSR